MSEKPEQADAARAVLLDTCAVIWLANGDPIAPGALAAITHAALADGVFVSPATAWEIGLLSRARGNKVPAVTFLPDPLSWFARFTSGPARTGTRAGPRGSRSPSTSPTATCATARSCPMEAGSSW